MHIFIFAFFEERLADSEHVLPRLQQLLPANGSRLGSESRARARRLRLPAPQLELRA